MINPDIKLKYDGPQIPQAPTAHQKGDKIEPKDIRGFFQFQYGAPTDTPESFMDQFRVCDIAPFVYLYFWTSGRGWDRIKL